MSRRQLQPHRGEGREAGRGLSKLAGARCMVAMTACGCAVSAGHGASKMYRSRLCGLTTREESSAERACSLRRPASSVVRSVSVHCECGKACFHVSGGSAFHTSQISLAVALGFHTRRISNRRPIREYSQRRGAAYTVARCPIWLFLSPASELETQGMHGHGDFGPPCLC